MIEKSRHIRNGGGQHKEREKEEQRGAQQKSISINGYSTPREKTSSSTRIELVRFQDRKPGANKAHSVALHGIQSLETKFKTCLWEGPKYSLR